MYSRLMSTDAVMVHPRRACAAACGRPATSRFHTATRCSPPSPTGVSTIRGYSTGADCASTLRCLARPRRRHSGDRAAIPARPRDSRSPAAASAGLQRAARRRSMPAIPAARCGCWPGSSPRIRSATSITGDDSLRRRPMRRIIVPLERMGARIHLGRRTSAAHDRRAPRSWPRSTSSPRCRAPRSRAPSCWPACTPTASPVSGSRCPPAITPSARCRRSVRRVSQR